MPQLLELLANNPSLKRVAPAIAREALPCVRLFTNRVSDSAIKIGASKLGGLPDLPDASEWPCRNGAPLSFIAQINVTALPKFDGLEELPPNTLLSFFYDTRNLIFGWDPDEKSCWRVVASSVSSAAPLKRRRRPKGLADEGVFTPCALFTKLEESLPDPYSRIIELLKLTEAEQDAYSCIFEDLIDAWPRHQLFGHAKQWQNDMQLDCQLISNGLSVSAPDWSSGPRRDALEAGVSDWRLLLQVDSDDNAGMLWGDLGSVYYWIKRSSLESRSFEDVWVLLQY
jgi:uncharacterized protein YwqG